VSLVNARFFEDWECQERHSIGGETLLKLKLQESHSERGWICFVARELVSGSTWKLVLHPKNRLSISEHYY
jgi:hypothetical protein